MLLYLPGINIRLMTSTLMHHADIIHPYTVLEHDLNGYGIMHGGRMLTLCDEVSYLAAHRHAGCPCLTRAVHQARFLHGVHMGEALQIHAKLGLTGNTSLWVLSEIRSADSSTLIMDAIFVFAAVNRQHQPQSVPPLVPKTEQDRALQQTLQSMHNQLMASK